MKFPRFLKFNVSKFNFSRSRFNASESEYKTYKREQLRKMAKDRGLSPSGEKPALARRLAEDDRKRGGQPHPSPSPQGTKQPDAVVNYPHQQQPLKLKRVSMTFEPLAAPLNKFRSRSGWLTAPRRTIQPINPPQDKHVQKEVITSLKALQRNEKNNEYGFAFDFERKKPYPERIQAVPGDETSVGIPPDFEFYGHSHPRKGYPNKQLQKMSYYPSSTDIVTLFSRSHGRALLLGSDGKFREYRIRNRITASDFQRKHRNNPVAMRNALQQSLEHIYQESQQSKNPSRTYAAKWKSYLKNEVGVEVKPVKKDRQGYLLTDIKPR
ncbi:MAG: SAP domain-containing protein [Candidatus Odinarchaeota archaeon]